MEKLQTENHHLKGKISSLEESSKKTSNFGRGDILFFRKKLNRENYIYSN